jgi:hypothetical protein
MKIINPKEMQVEIFGKLEPRLELIYGLLSKRSPVPDTHRPQLGL